MSCDWSVFGCLSLVGYKHGLQTRQGTRRSASRFCEIERFRAFDKTFQNFRPWYLPGSRTSRHGRSRVSRETRELGSSSRRTEARKLWSSSRRARHPASSPPQTAELKCVQRLHDSHPWVQADAHEAQVHVEQPQLSHLAAQVQEPAAQPQLEGLGASHVGSGGGELVAGSDAHGKVNRVE